MPSNERILTCPRCGEGEMTHLCYVDHFRVKIEYVKCGNCGFVEEKDDVILWSKLGEVANESK